MRAAEKLLMTNFYDDDDQPRLQIVNQILTVKQAVDSKDEQYREPDVGKRLKGEEHPLALALGWEAIIDGRYYNSD